MLSKRHFESAARHIRDELVNQNRLEEAEACAELIERISENPKFNRSRFRIACGLDQPAPKPSKKKSERIRPDIVQKAF